MKESEKIELEAKYYDKLKEIELERVTNFFKQFTNKVSHVLDFQKMLFDFAAAYYLDTRKLAELSAALSKEKKHENK